MPTVRIPVEEWVAVLRLVAPFVSAREVSALGRLHLEVPSGGRRRWTATNGRDVVVLEGDAGHPAVPALDVLLPAWLFEEVLGLDTPEGGYGLEVTGADDSDLRARVHAATGSIEVPAERRAFPEPDEIVPDPQAEPSVTVAVDPGALAAAVRALESLALRAVDEEEPAPAVTVVVRPDAIELSAVGPVTGEVSARVPATATGTAELSMHPRQLRWFLGDLGPTEGGDPLELAVAADGGWLRCRLGRWTAWLRPIPVGAERYRDEVEEVFGELFGRDTGQPDGNGEYQLPVTGSRITARLVDGDVPRLRVSATVIDRVPAGPELLAELNEQNAHLDAARVVHLDDRVVVQVDPPLDELDATVLQESIVLVAGVAEHLAPLMASLFGGETGDTQRERLWSSYLSSVVSVENGAEGWVDLTGPDAVEEWPFPGSVYVLTAFDPLGVRRTPERNWELLGRLAGDLLEHRAGFTRALGRSPDWSHKEPSLAAWGIPRDLARALGGRYGQEAIFEISADLLSVLACDGERVEVAPRRGAPQPPR